MTKFSLKITLLLTVALVFSSVSANCNEVTKFFPEGEYAFDKSIPTPSSFLGYPIGERYADWNEIVSYMKELSHLSNRVNFETFGKSYQNRPFVQIVISSKENQERIEEIREQHLALSSGNLKSAEEMAEMPVVVNLMSSIHGNEASGVNGSLLLAYFYAACENEEIIELLDKTVIVLSPGLNPDGINRFASWANTTSGITPTGDLASREFLETWPSSRTNHYWADCNRDWLSQQHPEGRYSVEMYRAWMANVVVDMHEQGGDGKGYFFSPGHPKRTNPNTSQLNQELTSKITNHIAQGFDNNGTLYYSKEGYDDFFYGKGAAYGDINGSIAFLVEQVASRGFLRPTSMGDMSFASTIKNQVFAGYYTILGSYNLREELHQYRLNFYKEVKKEAAANRVKGYLFTTNGQNGVEQHFIENLLLNSIEIYRLKRDISIEGREYSAQNSFVVPMDQPTYKVIKTLWEDVTQFEDNIFYDVSTWNLPRAYNVQYNELTTLSNLLGERLESDPSKVKEELNRQMGVVNGEGSYAYLIENSELYTPKLIWQLLSHNIYIRIGNKSFTSLDGAREFGRGTMVIPVSGQPYSSKELYTLIDSLSRESLVEVTSLNSGLMADFDLGSPSYKRVLPQRVAMIVGRGMSIPESGAIWHALDRRFNIPITLIEHNTVASADLSRYDVIVLASGKLSNQIVKEFAAPLKSWVENGGTLISTGNSYAITNLAKITAIEPLEAMAGDKFSGAILDCKIKSNSPLSWGLASDNLAVIKRLATIYDKKGAATVQMSYSEAPLLSGYATQKSIERVAGTPAIMSNKVGKGRVITIADDLNFRSHWLGSSKIFMNALLFGYLM